MDRLERKLFVDHGRQVLLRLLAREEPIFRRRSDPWERFFAAAERWKGDEGRAQSGRRS